MKWLFSIYKDSAYKYIVICGIKIRFMRQRASRNQTEFLNMLADVRTEEVARLKKLFSLTPAEIDALWKLAKAYNLNRVNKEELQCRMKLTAPRGLCNTPRSPRVIVSLTSYPKRMYDIHYCIYSILNQDFKPDKLILWLAVEQFPNREADIPEDVLKLQAQGLEIKWTKDIRSYKKLLPALAEFPEDIIVTADDDIYYPNDWLGSMYDEYTRNPKNVVAQRVQKMKISGGTPKEYWYWPYCITSTSGSHLLFPTGCGGVLYPPGAFTPEIFNIDKAMECAPIGDDIWFWGMRVLAGTGLSIVRDNPYMRMIHINPEREVGLNSRDGTLYAVNGLGENDNQLLKFIKAYPEVWTRVLGSTDCESDTYMVRK